MSAPSIPDALMGALSAELFSEAALPQSTLFPTHSNPTSSNLTPQAGFLASPSLLSPFPMAANSGIDHLG